MDIHKIKLFFNTILFLKPIQVFYRSYYFLRNRLIGNQPQKKALSNFNSIFWKNGISYANSYLDTDDSFTFLNRTHSFTNKIDWNYIEFGKLWTYNLNYFDYLNQEDISKEIGIKLIRDYVNNDALLLDGKDPYAVSLRGINWVKFLSKNQVTETVIDVTLYHHYYILLKNLEYHLLGNHLLENAFSLLFGAFYFQDEKLYNKSKNILTTELNEQILEDGGHFELSPMYHQIMLFRILDCVQLIKLNNWINDDLLDLLIESSSKMLSWLANVTFHNGDIPMVNDCAYEIAPSTKDLLEYGKSLGIDKIDIKLSDSGYRMFKSRKYELFMDLGEVGAPYQPGHVHSDTFNFILNVNNGPFIVDTGTSTYEKNERRQLERSTSSHNTITVGDYEQTQVWGGFRVAKRAKIVSFKESSNLFSSSHNGYKNIGVIHCRKFLANENSIIIFDDVNKQKRYEQIAHFHFHPSVKNMRIEDSTVYFENSKIEISFYGKGILIEKMNYQCAYGFNKTEEAIKLKVSFDANLKTIIKT